MSLLNYDPPGNVIDDVIIWVGPAPCANVTLYSTSDSTTVLECTVTDQEPGYYAVDVFIESSGYASISSSLLYGPLRNASLPVNAESAFPVVLMTSAVTSLDPPSGSTAGGTLLTITGSGFSTDIDSIEVTLGGAECTVTTSGRDTITCRSTQHEEGLNNDVSITISGHLVTNDLSYDYSSASTPVVDSIDGGGYISGGVSITVSGSNFGATLDDIKVQILADGEKFDFNVSDMSDNLCDINTTSDSNIECIVPDKAAGTYSVIVHVRGSGLSVASAMVSYSLLLTSFTPAESGHGGGVALTIAGAGFPVHNASDLVITVCGSPCDATLQSTSQLSCILEGSNSQTDLSCPVKMDLGSESVESSSNFQFLTSLTPSLSTVSPTVGGTGGGTHVTITGNNLLPDGTVTENDIIVTIDSAQCQWYGYASTPNDTTIQCRTSEHQTTVMADIMVHIRGKGVAVWVGDSMQYEYIDLWSSSYTWGGMAPPGEGDSVHIKAGQTVFLDVNTPVLNLILIEGALVFWDQSNLHLQAKYIFINQGRLQVGTENSPFEHVAVITLHGNVRDPEIPIYGAKVLGIRQGELDLHGKPRAVTWTRLSETASANSTTLTLQVRMSSL